MNTSGIYAEIYSKLAANPDLLPVLPESALAIKDRLRDPKCTNKTAADLLKSDPGLAAFVMRTANSARYLLRYPPSDLESAVLRLGLSTTLSLATVYVTRSVFSATSPACKEMMLAGYKNATKVAVLSYYLADEVSGIDAGKAMLSGLLQDVALPLLLNELIKRAEIFNDKNKLLSVIDELSPMVNILILKHWGFDEEIINVVRSRKQWLRDESKNLDLSDIVLFARWHSLLGTKEFSNCPPASEMPVIMKLPAMQLTVKKSIKLLIESQKEINALQKIFSVAS